MVQLSSCFLSSVVLAHNREVRTTGSCSLYEFWDKEAQSINWIQPYTHTFLPTYENQSLLGKWFVEGKLNIADQCITRWYLQYPNEIALIWVREGSNTYRSYTYKQLHELVNQTANYLLDIGVKKGQCVSLWLPMIPEAIIMQLACAKIGAVHNVIFSAFSIEKVKERMQDAKSDYLIFANEYYRGQKKYCMAEKVFQSSDFFSTLQQLIMIQVTPAKTDRLKNMSIWNEAILQYPTSCQSAVMDANDPLFVLYTSGTTAKPKGILHSSAGYLTYVLSTLKHAWDLKGLLTDKDPAKRDVWFCTADIGWITGHSYLTYGPMAYGAITILYEGSPLYPSADQYWRIIEKFHVTHFYTSPTALRLLAANHSHPQAFSMNSLKALGTVGEPIDEKTWLWFYEHIGKSRCPIIDTYWQTETGGYIFCPFVHDEKKPKPRSCSFPYYGIKPMLLDHNGHIIQEPFQKGFLCIRHSWPGMMLGTLGQANIRSSSFNQYPGYYCTGDEAYFDAEGYFWIMGRSDDMIKISGHRIGTAEIENCICTLPMVAESAVIGVLDSIKGQKIIAFVALKPYIEISHDLKRTIIQHVAQTHSPIAKPKDVIFVKELPKTRSGKILRRLLQSLYNQEEIQQDYSTLENPKVIEEIKKELSLNPF